MDFAPVGHNSGGRTRCIFRAHGDRGYTKLRNAFLQDRDISDETRGLVARLLSLPDDWEVTVQSIIASGKAGRDKVYRMIKEAEDHGYIKPDERQRESDGTLGRQIYFVSDDPETLITRAAQELYDMEAAQPHTEKPDVVEVVAEQQVSPCPAKPDLAEPRLAEPDLAKPLPANPHAVKEIEVYIKPPIVPQLALEPEPAPAKPKRAKNAVPDEYPYDFEEFWKVYPRREGKGAAFKHWHRLTITQKRRAYVALKAQLAVLKCKGEFCPHPATWIHQGRFDDDVTELAIAAAPKTFDRQKSSDEAWLDRQIAQARRDGLLK
jgi:hypothetical protein